MLGAVVSFSLARKFRNLFLRRFMLLQKIEQWEARIPKNKTFWLFVALRIPTTGIFDVVNYVLGLTSVGYGTFFFSTLLGSLPSMTLFYLLGGWSFERGPYYFLVFLVVIAVFLLLSRKKASFRI